MLCITRKTTTKSISYVNLVIMEFEYSLKTDDNRNTLKQKLTNPTHTYIHSLSLPPHINTHIITTQLHLLLISLVTGTPCHPLLELWSSHISHPVGFSYFPSSISTCSHNLFYYSFSLFSYWLLVLLFGPLVVLAMSRSSNTADAVVADSWSGATYFFFNGTTTNHLILFSLFIPYALPYRFLTRFLRCFCWTILYAYVVLRQMIIMTMLEKCLCIITYIHIHMIFSFSF